MKKPIIGITLDLVTDSDKYKYSQFPWYALRQNYAQSIIAAGGIPLMLPCQIEAIDEYLSLIDGLIVSGSDADIHPKFYNHELIKAKVSHSDEKTNFEIDIIKKVLKRGLPYLGICNGMQVLNVLLGGTLIQHIPDHIDSEINHEQPHPKNIPTHPIIVKEETLLYKLASSTNEIMVDSTHHQAVDKIGDGLIVSAIAPDGIIEAVELPSHKFALGVEWHPEYLNDNGLDVNLFKGLIEACRT